MLRSQQSQQCAFLAALLALGAIAGAPALAQSAQGRLPRAVPLIVEPIDESRRVVLTGNTRGEARWPEFDRGPVDDSFALNGMQLLLKRSAEHEQAAEDLADELQRRGSPLFHHWLTAAQYAEQFGVAQDDIAKINGWLRAHGFTVHAPSASRMTIDFSGTAGQVREAFGTEIHALEVNGEGHIANMRDPTMPAALAPAIEGVVSLHDFRPRPAIVPKPQYTYQADGFTAYAVVPADLATIYNFTPLFASGNAGDGQTIALIEDTDLYSYDDWTTFRVTLGLGNYELGSLTTVHPGGCTDPGTNADDQEAALDVEWASAAAPNAALQLASCADTTTTFGGLFALQNLVSQPDVPPIVSVSYLECEALNGAAGNAAYRAVYQQAVMEGVSVFVAAGDTGGSDCGVYIDTSTPAQGGVSVNGFASTVYNVAVGGTDFGDVYLGTTASYWSPTNSATYGSALSYVPEIPWNDSCASTLITSYFGYAVPYGPKGFCGSATGADFQFLAAGSGGPSNCAMGASKGGVDGTTPSNGTCRGWKKPSWQAVLGNPPDGVRDLPDISLFAADGIWGHFYIFCFSDPNYGGAPCVGAPDTWFGGGGTSFATPIMAGIQAIVNQISGERHGNPAPVYYEIARKDYGSSGDSSCESFATGGPSARCVFYDVTVGDNDVDCTGPYNCYDPGGKKGVPGVLSLSDRSYEPAFTAGTGWDFATGIGTVNATNLVLDGAWKR